jgi:DNA invertase Pin-like site-specific DNA recombinase
MPAKQSIAYGYCRVSGKGQVKGYGLPRQRSDIDSYADRHGIRIAHYYEDAHTGTEADRPEFVHMLSDMMGNGVKVVVVESLDRLARDLMIQTQLLAKLVIEGITLIAANTGEDVTGAMEDDPMRKAMIQIQGVFAELDKSLLVRRLRKGREQKRFKLGKCEGQKAYGEKAGEDLIVDRIRRLRRKPRGGKRRSLREIADILNDEGFVTRSGCIWSASIVQGIVERKINSQNSKEAVAS